MTDYTPECNPNKIGHQRNKDGHSGPPILRVDMGIHGRTRGSAPTRCMWYLNLIRGEWLNKQ